MRRLVFWWKRVDVLEDTPCIIIIIIIIIIITIITIVVVVVFVVIIITISFVRGIYT
jgi:hypothetical protein